VLDALQTSERGERLVEGPPTRDHAAPNRSSSSTTTRRPR
jgi:hypothetical protein